MKMRPEEAPTRYGLIWLYVGAILLLAGLMLLLMGCGDDDEDAKSDLAVENQNNDTSDATIGIMPDGWPNPAHKCMNFDSVVVGFWSTTDRIAVWIYNDHACPGANVEAEMTVINGTPRSIVNASTG